MRPSALFITIVFVALLQIFVSASDSSSSSQPSSSSGASVSLATQCDKCRDKEECSQAYKGLPGKFCRNYYEIFGDVTSCCCAKGDECTLAGISSCTCESPVPDDPLPLYGVIALFTVGFIVFGVRVCRSFRRPIFNVSNNENRGPVYVQTIVYAQGTHPSQQQGILPQQQVVYLMPGQQYIHPQQSAVNLPQQQQQHPVYAAGYAPNYGPGYSS